MRDEADEPWLRDMVEDEDVLALFTDDESALFAAVRHLFARAREDDALEDLLVETLDLAVERQNDDTEAARWITALLGEIGSPSSLGVLLRSLASDADETLQDAAAVALLRLGTPAIDGLIESLADEQGPVYRAAAYRVIGEAGILPDADMHQRIRDFVCEQLPLEHRRPQGGERPLEALVFAAARLGLRDQLPAMREMLLTESGVLNPAVQDAIEILEENVESVRFVPTVSPWTERYGSLFSEEGELARSPRRRAADRDDEADPDDAPMDTAKVETDLASLYWGTDDIDARRFRDDTPSGEDSALDDETEGAEEAGGESTR